MKLNQTTLNVLKNYASINQGLRIKGGENTVSTISPLKTLLSRATVPDVFPNTFCIYDLHRFLSVISMFKEPELEFTDSAIIVKGENQQVTYRFCDEKVIVSAPENEIKFPEPEISFALTQDAILSVIKAAGILQLPEIALVGEDGKLYLRAVNSKDVGSDQFNEQIGQTSLQFTAIFKPEYFSKLLPGDYNVDISSKKISRFTGPNIVYWIATESSSTF